MSVFEAEQHDKYKHTWAELWLDLEQRGWADRAVGSGPETQPYEASGNVQGLPTAKLLPSSWFQCELQMPWPPQVGLLCTLPWLSPSGTELGGHSMALQIATLLRSLYLYLPVGNTTQGPLSPSCVAIDESKPRLVWQISGSLFHNHYSLQLVMARCPFALFRMSFEDILSPKYREALQRPKDFMPQRWKIQEAPQEKMGAGDYNSLLY